MNVINEILRINEIELKNGYVNTNASWHSKYSNSAWVYIGNLAHELTEGDIICVMSQWGEIEDINLVRDEETGKSRGFCFLKYEDARSCILAIDNFVGVKILGRSIRIDHVENYRLPKHLQDKEKEEERETNPKNVGAGHAYVGADLSNSYDIHRGHDLFAPPDPKEQANDTSRSESDTERKRKKRKKKLKKDEKTRKRREKEMLSVEHRRKKRARKRG